MLLKDLHQLISLKQVSNFNKSSNKSQKLNRKMMRWVLTKWPMLNYQQWRIVQFKRKWEMKLIWKKLKVLLVNYWLNQDQTNMKDLLRDPHPKINIKAKSLQFNQQKNQVKKMLLHLVQESNQIQMRVSLFKDKIKSNKPQKTETNN